MQRKLALAACRGLETKRGVETMNMNGGALGQQTNGEEGEAIQMTAASPLSLLVTPLLPALYSQS